MRRHHLLYLVLLLPATVLAGGPLLPGFCDSVIPPPPDSSEPNDSMATAVPISPSDTLPLPQTFSGDDDEDWFVFHAYPFNVTGNVYTIRVLPPQAGSGAVGTFMNFSPPYQGPGLFFEFFSSDGTQLNILDPIDQGCLDPSPGNFFEYDLTFGAEDDYFVRISQCRNQGLDVNGTTQDDKAEYCIPDNAGYQVQIFQPVGAQAGLLSGTVSDALTGAPIGAAVLGSNTVLTTYSNPATGQFQSAVTVTSGAVATVLASGYQPQMVQFDIAEAQTTPCNVTLTREAGGMPDLQVNEPRVEPVSVIVGAAMTVSAKARNQGDAQADTSTLRFFLSSDATITPSDIQLDQVPINGLPAGAASAQQALVVAPGIPGTYFTGACVDAVAGESDTGNNCFGVAPLVVAPDPDFVFADSFEQTIQKNRADRVSSARKGGPGACVPL